MELEKLLEPTGRRDFFKKIFFYTSAGVLVHAFARTRAFAAELSLIDMTEKKRTDPANKQCVAGAKGIGYVEDLDKALKDKKINLTDKPGAAGKIWKVAEQTCENCGLYNFKKETPPKDTCALIPACLVHKKGSCNSWNPKA
ncbi:MAG: hypothetical protein A2Z20_03090 [Bdellovibrionales bacterium RBG_16_40_8]|nr:MAG: hypothetical protein A2Z20_03090 [Bdellovibrionales bacterium RBG_16_40_8]